MPYFYCPYCSGSKKYKIELNDQEPFCYICGEPLQKLSLFKITQITSILVVLGLLSPMIFYLIYFLEQEKMPKYELNLQAHFSKDLIT